MVALAVRFLGQKPVVCNARPSLNAAGVAIERRSWIEAGVRLREAVRIFLLADCEYYGVTISKRKVRQTPRALLEALKDAGCCDDYCYEAIDQAIEIGNLAAHCCFVKPCDLESSICSMHFVLDQCARYLVEPKAAGRLI